MSALKLSLNLSALKYQPWPFREVIPETPQVTFLNTYFSSEPRQETIPMPVTTALLLGSIFIHNTFFLMFMEKYSHRSSFIFAHIEHLCLDDYDFP